MLLILREEIVCAIILTFLIFYYCVNKVKDKDMLFLKISCISLAHVIFDMITVITVNNRDVVPDAVNRMLHIGFYITGLMFALCFYNYILQLVASYRRMRMWKIVGFVSFGVFVLLLIFLPMEYVEGKGTDYSYGPLAIIGYGFFLIYCTACLVMLVVRRDSLDQKIRRALIPILTVMYAAIVAQAVIPELLMTGGNVTLICIGLFVTLDNPDKDFKKQALWDFATGLSNRNCYDRDMIRFKENGTGKKGSNSIGFIVADMNYLKIINDNYGHAEGDRLIAAVADVLRDNLKTAENIYRIGGDEFVAIYISPDDRVIDREIENVMKACAAADEYAVPLSVSIGYARGTSDEELSSIFKRADKNMYEHKLRIKKDNPLL